MNLSKTKLILAAAAAAIAIPWLASADGTIYGNAGGTVGAERIAELSQKQTTPVETDFSNWYGNAGGPVGVERAAGASAPKAYAAGQTKQPIVYGRAGVPLPFSNN